MLEGLLSVLHPLRPTLGALARDGGWRLFGSFWRHIVFAAVFVLISNSASAAQVELVLSEDAGAYAEAALAVRRELGGNGALLQATAAALEGKGEGPSDAALVVTFGARAFKAALSARTGPILATLITRQGFEETLRDGPKVPASRLLSAVYLDQPVSRQLDLVRAVLPGRTRIGMLVSPDDKESGKFADAAALRKLTVAKEVVALPRDIYPALSRLLERCDAVVATPDPRIFNGGTLHNILLATYRQARPLFGFSPAYVQAGTLAAVYSSPEQMSPQIASAVKRFLAGNGLPPPSYSVAFSVKVNPTVARSLGITIEGDRSIEDRLRILERER